MRMKTLGAALIGAVLMASGGTALAHHSFGAEFDQNAPVKLEGTDPNHMGFSEKKGEEGRVEKQRVTYEVKPDKNGVVLEEQMMKASDTQMNYNLMMNVYTSNMDMIRTSIGKRN